ncbi:DUF4440 domain-containing protein [Streptomyces armeniacus]|uniref:DUF4440 domain-containing protein n=1 Tax=Streptomyces armeniacus TaxID=83291 RepID=A0A345Y0X0_9ACTN|nr:DUF4440 domain-containing protein [Streptomyces armeniacus]
MQAAIDGELRLLDPEVRASARLVTELLDPEFTEFGASGRRWDRGTVMTAMASGPGGGETPTAVTGMAGTLLASGVVHLTYVSERDGRRARRSSLWRHRTGVGWRLYFHQGTLADEA